MVFLVTWIQTESQLNDTSSFRFSSIGHFRITFGLFLKASLGAHLFIWKLVFIHMQMKTHFHKKGWAPGLALKKRPKVIRKWPICLTDNGICSSYWQQNPHSFDQLKMTCAPENYASLLRLIWATKVSARYKILMSTFSEDILFW